MNASPSFLAVVALLLMTVCGCASVRSIFDREPPVEFTVAAEAGEEGRANALDEARDRCGAYGAAAMFIDETRDPDGRLRHLRFRCER